ncbi:MAG: pyridoxamine 5'-phosphate oxidase family protein [Limisphaerales bacterium]
MEVARVDENGDLWFFTGDDTAKVREIESDPRVQVICQNGRASFVALGGRATLIRHDRALIRELWKPSFKVWFPGGVEDPNIVLIRVTGERGEYCDHTGVKGLNAFASPSRPWCREPVRRSRKAKNTAE